MLETGLNDTTVLAYLLLALHLIITVTVVIFPVFVVFDKIAGAVFGFETVLTRAEVAELDFGGGISAPSALDVVGIATWRTAKDKVGFAGTAAAAGWNAWDTGAGGEVAA